MLTRIEIDGFKSFQDFAVDLAPFVVILGPNASGKSNLFDAIRLLSALAETDLRSAVKRLRGEPHELFRRQASGAAADRMRLAVEVLLDPTVRDPWGATVEIQHTRVRYEVEIQQVRDKRGIERLIVAHEAAVPIAARGDRWLQGRDVSAAFCKTFLRYHRRSPWLETVQSEAGRQFEVHQDGRAGRTNVAEAAEATALSSFTSAEFPHLYALREELRSWKFLQLDPAALRRPSAVTDSDELEPDGSNLATVLARIQAETTSPTRPRGVLPDIAADVAALIPGVVDLHVEKDERNREYRIDVGLRDESPLSSRVVSDGTLRVLALLTLLHDPRHRGVICFEEPENGVHPARLRELVARLRDLASDPAAAVDGQEPPNDPGEQALHDLDLQTTQVIVNSHSPVVLAALHEEHEALFADMVTVLEPGVGKSHRTRLRPVRRQGSLDSDSPSVGAFDVERYLATVQTPESSLP